MSEKDSMDFDASRLSGDQQNQLLFMMLVQQHQQIAMMGMGKLKNPATDKIERDLSSAKYAIDTLNMLKSYTESNISRELKDYLEQTISTLQLNYVDEIDKDKKPKPEEEKNTGESSIKDGSEEEDKNKDE